MKKISKKDIISGFVISAIFLAMAGFTISLSFIQNPSISPLSPDTLSPLVCSWNKSGDANSMVNITWTNGSQVILKNSTTDTSILEATYTSRGHNWYCNVTIWNATSVLTSQTNVTIKNANPSFPNITNSTGQLISANQTEAYEDLLNNYTYSSSDPDTDYVTFQYGSLPSGATFSNTGNGTGLLQWTPVYTSPNTNISITATDEYGSNPGTAASKIQFNVIQRNDAPYFSPALSSKAMNESQTFNYNIVGADEELNYPLNFTLTVTPSLSLIVNATGSTTAVIMFQNNATASFGDRGNYTVNITVYDNQSANFTSSFNLEILSTNRYPNITNLPSQINGTQGQAFSVLFYATDQDANQTLNFSIQTSQSGNCNYGNIWNNITTTITYNLTMTNATGNLTITNLTNSHVICRNITLIVVDDKAAEDSENVFLNITNTNDPPIVQVLSSFSNNSGGQTNISKLVGFAGVELIYLVNGTDVDMLTYAGDVLSFADNTTLFNINSSTGLVRFTPGFSDVGNHSITITVTDSAGLNDSEIMNLEIINNTVPVLNPIPDVSCFEDVVCYVFINASDGDGDNLTFTSDNSQVLPVVTNTSSVPVWSAYVSYTPGQEVVGNYSVMVSVTDPKGAIASQSVNVSISNTNDAPVLVNFTMPTIVETHTAAFNVYATDDDYTLPGSYEYVNFTVTNISGKLLFNITTYLNASNRTYGQVVFVPQAGDAGNYVMNFTATDYFGLTSTISKNFTVYPKSNPPNITQVKPYQDNGTVYTQFGNTSLFPGSYMNINVNENQSFTFDVNVTDENVTSLNYTWYLDGVQLMNNKSMTYTFGFFSSGAHNMTIFVEDDLLENTSFYWNFTVNNVNRPPKLVTNLSNLVVNGTTTFTDYFILPGSKYIDPDDDLDSDNVLDFAETSTLAYNSTSCIVAGLSVSNQSLRVEPTTIGSCNVTFTAIDLGGLTLASNTVTINTTQVSNQTTVIQQPTPSSGGGSSTRRSPIPIPITRQDLKPQAIEIIVPEIVTVYENATVIIPVIVQNTWNSSLKGIHLNVTSDRKDEDVKMQFSEVFFEELKKGEKRNVTLSVSNYRLGEDYKLQIMANVTEPDTDDSAYVFLNTIEQSKSGQDVKTKVTFAQDLLNENPECLELNELLQKAKENLNAGGDLVEVGRIVDGVIEGCKYLVSVSKRTVQKPETILQKAIRKEYRPYMLTFLGIAAATMLIMSAIKRRRAPVKKKEEEDAKKKTIEEATGPKPYWPEE